MLFVDNHSNTDPRLNLALEEYLLRHVQSAESLLLFYTNEPSVVVGRNQNIFEEVDPSYLERQGLHLVRRLSGGGTVYHDLGNLNYSFIVGGQADLHKFRQVLAPIIRTLRELGVDASFRERSDIVVGNHKISGNAQYASKGRMFSHGTLLFDADLDLLERAIRPRNALVDSRAVQSVRSSVRNIRGLLPAGWAIADLRDALLQGITGLEHPLTLSLDDEDWAQIRQLAAERYSSWEWNIGRSPRFSLSRSKQFGERNLELRVEVEHGRISALGVGGDLLDGGAAAALASAVTGLRYDRQELLTALRPLVGRLPAGTINLQTMLTLLY